LTKLRLNEISHHFGETLAVDQLSLEIGEGEIVCLLGPSGCGKTTSLRLAAGLEELQSGSIEINGQLAAQPGRAVPPEKRRIGMVFQDYALFPHLSVAGNVGFGLADVASDDRKRQVDAILRRVGLQGRAEAFPHQLSGGEQQRVALARALAPEPGLMLMDEPFANLDVTLRNAVRDDTLDLLKSVGASVLLVTHDPEEAMRMADRIAVMQAGRVVQCGSPEEVYLKPANPFMARFFGPVNEFDVQVSRGLAATPFGTQPCDLSDGPALGIVRPEAIQIEDTSGDGHIEDVRLIGAYWRVMVRMADGRGLRARTSHRPPNIGVPVSVTIDPARTILFPAGAG
jgi:iron(III) transport system ATP-binding protein